MKDRPSRLPAVLLMSFSLILAGCSDRVQTEARANRRSETIRLIKTAREKVKVVVPFRGDLLVAPVAALEARYAPKAGDRVILSDVGEGGIFLAKDLEALKFYHSSPGPEQLSRFRALGDEGRLFVVPRGTVGTIGQVVEGELPEGLKAVELQLTGNKGGPAWVSDPFVRRPVSDQK